MLRLYLVQHGEAVDKEEDPDRPLTDAGQDEVHRSAEFAQLAGIQVGEIRHSGKLRAQQTADIFAEHLEPQRGVAAVEGLGPKDDVKAVAEGLERESAPLMLVGHLPFLTRLAAYLLTGDAKAELVLFRTGGILCLDRDDEGRWALAWMITPDLLK
jgi:phosphohistidine phosphatase